MPQSLALGAYEASQQQGGHHAVPQDEQKEHRQEAVNARYCYRQIARRRSRTSGGWHRDSPAAGGQAHQEEEAPKEEGSRDWPIRRSLDLRPFQFRASRGRAPCARSFFRPYEWSAPECRSRQQHRVNRGTGIESRSKTARGTAERRSGHAHGSVGGTTGSQVWKRQPLPCRAKKGTTHN